MGSQRPLWGTLVRLPRPLSLMFPYSRRVMIVLRRPCTVLFLTDVFWPFRSIAASTFHRISPGRKHFVGSGLWPNCLSQYCVRRVSLMVPKHLDSSSTLPEAVVTLGLTQHTLFLGSKGLDPPQAPTPNVESGSPVKRLLFAGGVFLEARIYYQWKCAKSSKILNLFIHAPLLTRDDDR